MARKNYGNLGAKAPGVPALQRELARDPRSSSKTPPDVPRTGIDSYQQYPSGPASINTTGLAFGANGHTKKGSP
jgi:hypothetical protein